MVAAAVALVVSASRRPCLSPARGMLKSLARPLPHRFLAYVPFASMAMTITAAAKVELFTYLVCQAHQPVVNPDRGAPEEPLAALVARSVVAAAFSGKPLPPLPAGLDPCAAAVC